MEFFKSIFYPKLNFGLARSRLVGLAIFYLLADVFITTCVLLGYVGQDFEPRASLRAFVVTRAVLFFLSLAVWTFLWTRVYFVMKGGVLSLRVIRKWVHGFLSSLTPQRVREGFGIGEYRAPEDAQHPHTDQHTNTSYRATTMIETPESAQQMRRNDGGGMSLPSVTATKNSVGNTDSVPIHSSSGRPDRRYTAWNPSLRRSEESLFETQKREQLRQPIKVSTKFPNYEFNDSESDIGDDITLTDDARLTDNAAAPSSLYDLSPVEVQSGAARRVNYYHGDLKHYKSIHGTVIEDVTKPSAENELRRYRPQSQRQGGYGGFRT
ncbi:hypothetical protein F5Y16DRAFT_423654 [Xylariaceae sp. FL0255]|nr:hypothetical protein F5Y16DRAFT_423654 [Xylariaceae sp. FL0255]